MSQLDGFRQRLGTAPRSFSPEVTREIRASYNPLLSTAPWDSLMRVFFDQAKLRERGEVVWARVIQANELLFAPGLKGESHPATILHAGPTLDDPSLLFEITSKIQSLGGKSQEDPEQKAAVDLLHPSRRKYWVAVLPSIAGRTEVFCSDLLIFRKLLPQQPKGATLQKLLLPLLVEPDETRAVMQVPSHFWPQEFLDFWDSE
jgi:hypothetical protein